MSSDGLEIILTHEHTDFDALASLLAASLLYRDALPVLPRRLNRNVHSFLALYRNRFPFITDQDLPRGKIARAILVDTRAVNWVRGMDAQTPQTIIDHHVSDEPVPTRHQLWSEAVGANTTLLVERLIEANVTLSALDATLLTLGIHEDTGSLTYPSTTHRDARALAWLMEPRHQVNLQVVNQFLNHPLSEAQRAVLQSLLDHSEFVDIHGHAVVIATAEAAGFREELSALATRLRDFHETDAIFMIIDLGDVLQVVARSATNEVDVGKVASALGGGGHVRAAAAPIRDRGQGISGVRDRIVALLQEQSRAAVTVQEIMSAGRPQCIPPDMTITAAAELMRRYGHEGFPVLRAHPDGHEELLGVLTRREVDRALNHELGDQPVTRFMRAGQVSVRPDASISALRQVMIDSNWGQIPVIEASGRIIGIVTRTDLIKLWDADALPRRHAQAIAARLKSSLRPVQHALLRLIGEEVSVINYTVYIVGGFVRDLLLNPLLNPLLNGRQLDSDQANHATLDMDIVIEGNAIAFAQRMHSLYGGRVVPHQRFNTAKWLLDDPANPVHTHKLLADLGPDAGTPWSRQDLPAHLDFVTARTEFYTAPSVLPTVEDSSIKLDLHRRDFTINTLALCLNPNRWGELLDFYGGVNDLNQRLVRVLHSLSFVDDPTRILRAVRYEQRFNFTIEPRTLELLLNAGELLTHVTPARIRHELERILHEETPEKALARLDELGILAHIHPALRFTPTHAARFAALRDARAAAPPHDLLHEQPLELLYWGVWVADLAATDHVELSNRLGLRGDTQQLMRSLERLARRRDSLSAPNLPPSRIVAALDGIDPVALALGPLLFNDQPRLLASLRAYLRDLRYLLPELDGHALAELGVPRGPHMGELLTALRAAKVDGRLPTRADEEAFIRARLSPGHTTSPSPTPPPA